MADRLMHRPSFDAGRKLRSRVFSFADGFRSAPTPKPRRTEIAVASQAIMTAAEMDAALVNPSGIIKNHGIATIDEMRREATIHALASSLFKMRARSGWTLQPHPDDPNDELGYAAEVEDMFQNIAGGFKNRLMEMWTAYFYGWSATERVVRLVDTQWGQRNVIVDFKTREPHSFTFKTDRHGNVTKMLQTTGWSTEEYDPLDFVLYVYDQEFGNPYGRSALEPVYRPWLRKKCMVKYLAQAAERFGNPTIILTVPKDQYDPNSDMTTAQDVLKSIQNGTEIITQEGWTIDYKEIAGTGVNQLLQSIKDMNFEIAVGLLSPEQLGFTEAAGGSYNKAEVQQTLWLGVVEDLGQDTAEDIIGRQCIVPYMAWNHPGATQIPQFVWSPLVEDDKTDMLARVMEAIRFGPGGFMDWTKQDANRLRTWAGLDELPDDFVPTETVVSTPPDAQAGGTSAGGVEGGVEDVTGQTPPVSEQFADAFPAWPRHPDTAMTFADRPRRRPLTVHEKHINFADVESRLNAIEGSAIERIVAIMYGARDDLLKRIEKILGVGKNQPDNKAINELTLKGSGDLKQTLLAMLTMTRLAGKGDVRTEVMAATGQKLKFADESLYLVPANMRKFFASLPLSGAERAALGRQAFYVTDVTQQEILKKVKAILYKAMANGDNKWAATEIRRVFSDYLETGELKNGELAAPYRVDTIVRTNMSTAYNAGRKAMMEDPQVAPAIEAYQYTAILDDATTDYCAAMDGQVFDKDEFPWPPAHHNCRSFPVSVFRGEEFTLTTVAQRRDDLRKAAAADRKVAWRDQPINPDRIVRAPTF